MAANTNRGADIINGRGLVLKIGQLQPTVVNRLASRYISGLLGTGGGKKMDGQIIVDTDLIPSAVAPSDLKLNSRLDSDNYVKTTAYTLSRNMSIIEQKLDLFIVPLILGGEFKFMGKTFMRFAFLRKNGCTTFKDAYRKYLNEVMGREPVAAIVDKYAKALEYSKTDVYRTPFYKDVFVIPGTWTTDPKAFDGRSIHYCPKDENEQLLIHHDDLNFDITLKSVLHLRSWKGSGSMFKGTSTPVTLRMLHHLIKSTKYKTVSKLLKAGYFICTADTLKDVKSGLYKNIEFFWHNDSDRVSFWQDVKLTFSQWAMRRIFSNVTGVASKLNDNVKKFSDVMKSGIKPLVHYLLQNKDMYNDEDLPLNIVDVFSLIGNRLPAWIHRSTEFAVLKALVKVMKGLLELRIGTRNMKHWNLKQHLGLGMRAFVSGDPTLERHEVGIPKFSANKMVHLFGKNVHLWEYTNIDGSLKWIEVKHFHWDWRDAVVKRKITIDKFFTEVRRHPQTFTSSQQMRIVVRDDDFPYLTLGTSIMNDFGADWDGDKMEVLVVPQLIYNFHTADSMKVKKWLKSAKRKVNWTMSDFYRPSVFTMCSGLEDHHAQLYELLGAEPVGKPHAFSERVAHWMYKVKKATAKETFALVSEIENSLITDIIAGKKHNAKSVVHLPELDRFAKSLNLPFGGNGYRIANAKTDFSKVVTGKKDITTYKGEPKTVNVKLTVKKFPAWIKSKLLKGTWITKHWPLHYIYFNSLLNSLPDEIPGTDVNLDELNLPRLSEILLTLKKEFTGVIVNKLRMIVKSYGDGSIYEITNNRLNKLHSDFLKHNRIDPSDAQTWLREESAKLWTELTSKLTLEERAAAELFMIGYALVTRDGPTSMHPNQTKHQWIFTTVSAASFKKFMDLLYGEDTKPPHNTVKSDK